MIRDKIINIAQISAIVFVMASVFFRSLVGGLLVTLPAVCAVAVNVGVMGWMGIPFNIPTSLVSAMVVGLGSDFAIYLLYAVREQRRHSANNIGAIAAGVASAGPACVYTALAIAGGFSMLMLSRKFVPHMQLGGMLSLAMITSVAITLVAIPAMLALFKPSFLNK
jgi:predicted RND superfamily exporter protein